MNKKFLAVICIVLLAIIGFGLFSSNLDYANYTILDLNNKISSGDEAYNQAVQDVNEKKFDDGINELNNAKTSFSDAKDLIDKLKEDSSLNDDVYSRYIECVDNEIMYKENASSNLELAANALKHSNINTANNYIYQAGDDMHQALTYQYQRSQIVENNPDKFENSTIQL